MPSPNIVYIISDQHRGQAMSHTGDPNVHTPTMDRLAQEGVSFTRAYANCPVCTPSRGTIFSGRHAHAGPVQGFWDVYKPSAPSTAHLLRQQGYRTAYFGKWHPGIVRDQISPAIRNSSEHIERMADTIPRRAPENLRGGFEDWFAYDNKSPHFDPIYFHQNDINPTRRSGYTSDVFSDLAIEYVERYSRSEPLFLVLSIHPPHFPLEVPDEWIRLSPAGVQLRPNVNESSPIPHSKKRLPDLRERMTRYYGMIENLDWNIGRLVDTLDGIDRFRNTLIVYTSDHGEFMGSHGRVERKEHPHEESVRIPAIFRWPDRIPATGTDESLFSLVDLQKTVVSLAGSDAPPYDQGFDYSNRILERDESLCQNRVLIEMHGSPRWILDEPDWRGVITDTTKYVFYDTGEELLFDLESDPYEMNNLADSDPALKQHMKSMLLNLLEETREPYFDVLMHHGVTPDGPVIDVSEL